MIGQSYFQLLSPLIFTGFAAGFLVLWRQARDIRALRLFALSYLLGALAMFGDFMRDAMHPDFASAFLSALYLSTTAVFCAGLYEYYSNRVPWKALALAGVAVFALFSTMRYGLEAIVPSAWAINIGVVSIYLYAIHDLHGEMRRRIDRVLQLVIAASSILLVVRSAIVFSIEGVTMTASNYAGSLAAVTLQLLFSVVALAVAGVLFVMFGKEIVRRLTETGETDPLTGVLNRRGFDARVAAITGTDATPGTAHAVVMADIDRFKSVNDTFGHEAGDDVIRAFARLICDAVRDGDLVVRWGGEEFLVVLHNTERASAHLFAETVRLNWERLSHDVLDGAAVTASLGVAGWPGGQDIASAISRADAALYRAKQEGRNLVHEDRTANAFATADVA